MKIKSSAILTVLVSGFIAFLPKVQAVSPPPDGGYPGGNTAEGQSALLSLTTGGFNTAVGYFSLRSDTTASYNTAIGAGALFANIGDQNTATGVVALFSNTTGIYNTANGTLALFSNTTGFGNTANGAALFSNTTGTYNTANGFQALFNNTTGSRNTAVGYGAGIAVATASDVIAIGTAGANVDNSCYIGHIFGTFNTAQSAVVYVDPDGRLGTGPSARRFKKDIADMGAASEVLLSMRPVTFHFKTQDTEKAGREISQFGLIAEEVAEVNPDLILRDKEGEIYSVRYDAVNAMLLNEFLKEHRKVERLDCKTQEQEATIAELKSEAVSHQAMVSQLKREMDAVMAHSKEQDLQIQRVSAQIELNQATPRMVVTERP